MPTVPTYGGRKVQDAPLPGARLSANAPEEAFGAGPSFDKVISAGQGLIKVGQDIAEQERKKADQLAVLDADTKLSALETDLQYNPKDGAITKQGKDVFGLYDSVSERWRKGVEDIQKGLNGSDQMLAFQRSAASRWESLDRSVQAHVAGETKKYDENVTESYLANERDAAVMNYLDNNRIGLSIERQRAAIADHAGRNGLPEEWVKQKIVDAESKTHVSVIGRMLAGGNDLQAKGYFDAHKDAIDGADTVAVEKALEEGSVRGESQRTADKIWSESDGNYGRAMDLARGVGDPRTRQLTEEFVRRRFSDQKAQEAEVRDDIYIKAANLSEQHPGESVRLLVDPDKWQQLTPEQRSSLERRSLNPENDGKTWLDFLELSPQQIRGLSRSDFESKYWVHFDSSHKSRAEETWTGMRSGGDSAEKHTADLSFDNRVRNTLFMAGMIPDKTRGEISGDYEKTYTAFETEAAHRKELFERQTGKKASGDDVQGILDRLVLERVKVKHLFGDKVKLYINVTQDERGTAYVPIEKIPAADRSQIENVFRAKGRKATDDKVQRAYAAYVMKDRALLDAILAEK